MLEDICANHAMPETPHERSLFAFIKDWLNGEQTITTQTSGSTGPPKPWTFSRSQAEHSAQLTAQALSLTSGMNALLCMNPSYIAGKMMIIRSLTVGMYIYAVDPTSHPLIHLPHELIIDFAAMVPLQVSTILSSAQREQMNRIRICLVGGAQTDAQLQSLMGNFSTAFYESFGMTETLSHIALRKLPCDESTPFTALPGVRVAQDERGCLVIHAPHLATTIYSNDMVDLIDDHSFFWKGRIDNIINTGGVKVSPEKIEQDILPIFSSLGLNNRFFISSISDGKLGEQIILVIEGAINNEQADQLLRLIHQTIERYSRPRAIYVASSFELTPTNKIKRRESLRDARQLQK